MEKGETGIIRVVVKIMLPAIIIGIQKGTIILTAGNPGLTDPDRCSLRLPGSLKLFHLKVLMV